MKLHDHFTSAEVDDMIKERHATFCRLTHYPLPLIMARHRSWAEWLAHREPPFTSDDLAVVISYLRDEIRLRGWPLSMLRFRNIVENREGFEEWLAIGSARSRVSKPVPPVEKRNPVTGTTQRVAGPDPGPRNVDEVIKSEAFKEFVNLRKELE